MAHDRRLRQPVTRICNIVGPGHPTAISSCQVGRPRNSIRKNVRDHGLGVDHPFCASVSVLSPLSPPLILLAVPLLVLERKRTS